MTTRSLLSPNLVHAHADADAGSVTCAMYAVNVAQQTSGRLRSHHFPLAGLAMTTKSERTIYLPTSNDDESFCHHLAQHQPGCPKTDGRALRDKARPSHRCVKATISPCHCSLHPMHNAVAMHLCWGLLKPTAPLQKVVLVSSSPSPRNLTVVLSRQSVKGG